MLIRDFEPADQEAVVRLNQAGSRDADTLARRGIADAPDLLNIPRVYQLDGCFLVGVVDGALVAMAAVQRVDAATFELKRMRVALTHQRRGYARRLVEALEERALALGANSIVLDTTIEQIAAQRLYEACGYYRERESTMHNDAGTFRLVHYSKQLS